MTLESRFWAKVRKSERCWQWIAFIDKAGYGRIGAGSEILYAHRLSYEIHFGAIPDGLVIDHKCRNRACVNPRHLHAVSRKQNVENQGGAAVSNRSSGLRNVYFHRPSGRWYVRVGHLGTSVHGGYFATKEEANAAAIALRNQLFTNNLADKESA